ncbi:MAG: hypothetical protein HY684_03905 [Chloroflexi bacterium]|nr:hypothetical protein [Chloroflexota bacterium]
MYFSPLIDRYFNGWIGLFTWDSKHPYDMARFYKFLKALGRYSRKRGWLGRLHRKIVIAAADYHSSLAKEHIRQMADFFVREAETIFFYESTPFPDALVESKDPYAMWASLQTARVLNKQGKARPLYTQAKIEEVLAKRFGEGWRDQRNANRNSGLGQV